MTPKSNKVVRKRTVEEVVTAAYDFGREHSITVLRVALDDRKGNFRELVKDVDYKLEGGTITLLFPKVNPKKTK